MALIGNYSVLNKSCGKWRSGSSVAGASNAQCRSNWNSASDWCKFGLQDRSGGSGSIVTTASKPNGYYPSGAWALPTDAAGMSTSRTIVGVGSFSASGILGKNGEAGLTGSGDITVASLALIVSAIAAISGTGSLAGDIIGKLEAVAALSGTGDVTATIKALANILSGLTGTGDISAVINASGTISSDIVVTGDLLTTANVASSVWSAIAEGTLTYEAIQRILLAVAAGKTTISGSDVSFRDQADTKDRIFANMTGSERTDVTLDGS